MLTQATPNDEVLLKLESSGGMVHSYGLASSQLDRLRKKNVPSPCALIRLLQVEAI